MSPSGPLEIHSIDPTVGPATGGTRVTIEGLNLDAVDKIQIGGVDCLDLAHEAGSRVQCTTGRREFIEEGVGDVVVSGALGSRAELPGAFSFECSFTTSTGRKSCGAAPPRPIAPQPITSWITQSEYAMQTDGFGTPSLMQQTNAGVFDLRGQQLKVFLSVQNMAAVTDISLLVGDSGLRNYYQFKLRGTQGQQWLVDGDDGGLSVSFAPENYTSVGNPNRGMVTDYALRVVDNATGTPVQVKISGLALVPEPAERFPSGVATFTFDDNWDDMVQIGAPILAQHGFQATAFVIVDRIGKADHTSMFELHALQEKGWDIAAHAMTSAHHNARFPTLPLDVVENDFVDTREFLMKNHFNGYDHCAYPGGDFSYNGNNILPLATKYFASCRTIYERQREASPPADPLKLRVLYITQGTALLTAMQAVDNARANHEWIILVFHKLVDVPPAAQTEWPAADFSALVEHVSQSGIAVQTVTEVLEGK
jgi:peptidoglycan/xylan/chitin deacetylase (PgdA/CDA1 family)